MKTLQLLSPLFFACFTGVVYFSFGDNATIPETSKRFHSYANYRILTKQNLDTIYDNGHMYYSIKMNDHIHDILHESNIQTPLSNAFEFSVNRNDRKYIPEQNKYFGFEWKVLDQYPTEYVMQISLFIIMLAQWFHNRKIFLQEFDGTLTIPEVLDNYVPNIKVWLKTILFQGWNSYLDLDYANFVIQSLKLTEFSTISTHTCFDFLNDIYSNLYSYFKTKKNDDVWMILCYFPNFFTLDDNQFIKLPNINKMNYNKMMDDFKKYFPDIFSEYVLQVRESSDNEDFEDMESWQNPN